MIILTILKIIGIAAGCLVGAGILSFLLLLVSPVVWKGEWNQDATKQVIHLRARWMGWIPFLRLNYVDKRLEFDFWLFGIRRIHYDSKETRKERGKSSEAGKGAGNRSSSFKRIRRAFAEEQIPRKAPELWKAVQRLWKHVKPSHAKGKVLFGTGEPDTTALCYAGAAQLAALIHPDILVVPDMERKVFEVQVTGGGSIFGGYVLLGLKKLFGKQAETVKISQE